MAIGPKRINSEYAYILKNPIEGVEVIQNDENFRYYHINLSGPKDSPYEGGVFELEWFYPESYPKDPPKVRFLTKIYHPNIDGLGRICLNILKNDNTGQHIATDQWATGLRMHSVLLSISALMGSPNPKDPLATDVAKEWEKDEAKAIETAKEWTKLYATK
uniref:UBIQUITIN_CONJUGAT_2 domain-containing protein n=1 Tax=Mesocestoides corti TaxID=53468 RepID=A0A5K3FGZ6_MESCO